MKNTKPNLNGRNKPKPVSEMDIFRLWQARQGLNVDSRFADALGISRAKLWNWYNGINEPETEGLQEIALAYRGKWQCELAVEVLNFRKADVPCVCLESIGDNGPCPKHGGALPEGPAQRQELEHV